MFDYPAGDVTGEVWNPPRELMNATEVEELVCPETNGSYYVRVKYRRWVHCKLVSTLSWNTAPRLAAGAFSS